MTVIYQTTITQIGSSAMEALQEHMLILFREGVPEDLADYCFIHRHGKLMATLTPGMVLELAGTCYPITAVGNVVQQNMQELGHITLRFDGASTAEYPGCIHVAGNTPQQINVGCVIQFLK